MARMGPRYKVHFRRKREGKTDYRKRLKLLKSKMPRLVVRITSKRVHAMICKPSDIGDYTLVNTTSDHLKKYGWKGDGSNTSAAYLVGLLCGKRALNIGIKECILDIGAHTPKKGIKAFAALRGALDAGLSIPHEKEVMPDENRISGKHVAEYAKKLKTSSEDEYKKRFSKYLARGLPPEQLDEHFNTVKNNIVGEK